MSGPAPSVGATLLPGGGTAFRVWAPRPEAVELAIESPKPRTVPMVRSTDGFWSAAVPDLGPGTRYRFRLDHGRERADPASRSQPEGVRGPSEVVDPGAFPWTDAAWTGVPSAELVFYELHVGTFSPDGTFAGVADRIAPLVELGVTAVELMPVAEFPGTRNWGYDGVFPFAVQHSYGGLRGLQGLVDAAHRAGLAVYLDVVHNHVGPEGNFLAEFGPYFTESYRTPWGSAVNFADADSDPVRDYFVESAAFLADAAHLDGLRVDAVHAIVDPTARPFLADLTESLRARTVRGPRRLHLVAESALNDPRVVRPTAEGGYGFDAMWNDDFHHAIHGRLTGESTGYYSDFTKPDAVRTAWTDAFVLAGTYSIDRRRRHGAPAEGIAADRFVVCVQDHDQVGNRPFGERLSSLVPPDGLRLAAGLLLLSPYLPLLFMGEEYGETAPFLYFTDHEDPAVVEAVRTGRAAEFAGALGGREPPDPQAEETFRRSRLTESLRSEPAHRALTELYRELLRVRRELGPPARVDGTRVASFGDRESLLVVHPPPDRNLLLFHLGTAATTATVPVPSGRWALRVDSSDRRWGGPGSALPRELEGGGTATFALPPRSFAVYRRSGGAA